MKDAKVVLTGEHTALLSSALIGAWNAVSAPGAAGYDVRTSVITLDNVPRALAARDTRGLIKLVADGRTRKLLGAHILAPEGADSIQTAALAIRGGVTVEDLAEMIFPYLTTVEGLKLAALGFTKNLKRLSCCAG